MTTYAHRSAFGFSSLLNAFASGIGLVAGSFNDLGASASSAAVEIERFALHRGPKRRIKKGEGNVRNEARHRRFVAAYNANPMNFVPGHIRHEIYRIYNSQATMEAAAARWLKSFGSALGYRWPVSR